MTSHSPSDTVDHPTASALHSSQEIAADSLSFAPHPGSSFWRSLQTLNISRILVAITLLLLLNLKSTRELWIAEGVLPGDICLAYVLVSIGFFVLAYRYKQRFLLQLMTQVWFDIVIISLLYLASGGGKSGFGILYLFPLAGAAILAPLLLAFFVTALVTLVLLSESVFHILETGDVSSISQSGLFGAAFFAVVYVVNRLAKNLIRQEQLATRRGDELLMQQAINRLVIADMGDGIVVLDQEGCLFEINPAAERMLGRSLTKEMAGVRLAEVASLHPVNETLNAIQKKNEPIEKMDDAISFVSIPCYPDASEVELGEGALRAERPHFMTHLKLRFVFVNEADIGHTGEQKSSYIIIFMQDVSDIENQAQQLKLASMGRLTASIAHEVRNPLSSISYAASLLSEDVESLGNNPTQSGRLLKIVDDNVQRLNQLIEDILKLSRKAKNDVEPYFLMGQVQSVVQDFIETRSLDHELIVLDAKQDFKVSFDPDHLREIIFNLLSNATRYASGQPASIKLISLITTNGRHELHIQDDGPGIPYDVRAHLFEPFYTTSRMGTGLGLYMARELCLNNQALLDYEYRSEEGDSGIREASGRFVINFSGYST
ncbi:sensor histidine kinase [Undibacterium sp. SXout7W]|uniref:sensor histidine kinase n=1 Tax=Undibacterium sp. SXout7W TaxID=3413049 RepID=UPI003BF2A716